MKTTLHLLTGFAVVIYLCVGSSIAGWQWMNPQTTNKDLQDVWGASQQDVFFVGDGGVILHWDGTNWQQMDSGTSEDLRCLWGFSAEEVFAGGIGGVILHWDGAAWQPMDSGTSGDIAAMWGSSADSMWAAACSSVLHWDGLSWSEAYVDPKEHELTDVWGLGPEEVYVAGEYGNDQADSGLLLHWNGAEWQDMFDLDFNVKGVWGSASNDIHVVCSLDPARLFHWDGESWTQTEEITDQSICCIWGVSAQEVYCAGGGTYHPYLLRWDGSSWSWEAGVGYYPRAIYNLGGIAGDRALGVGEFGYVIERIDQVWTQISSVTDAVLWGAWAASPQNVYAVGNDTTILHFNGSQWTLMDNGGATYSTLDVWGTSSDNVFTVGRGILHYDGTAWRPVAYATGDDIYSIDGISSDLAFPVGGGGQPPYQSAVILRWNGATWTEMSFEANSGLHDVCTLSYDDAVAVGYSGLIARWDGTAWAQQDSPTLEDLRAVWGNSSDNLIAVGLNQTAVHWDGSSWQTKPCPSGGDLFGVWGSASDDVYAVGGDAFLMKYVIMHWNGFDWSVMLYDDGTYFKRISSLDGRQFLAVGYHGSILRWDGRYPLGMRMSAPVEIRQGERFGVRGYLDNPGPAIGSAAVFIALENAGVYWFWPRWTPYNPATGVGLDFQIMAVSTGSTRLDLIPDFTWPAGVQVQDNYFSLYGAMLDPGKGEILGAMAISSVYVL